MRIERLLVLRPRAAVEAGVRADRRPVPVENSQLRRARSAVDERVAEINTQYGNGPATVRSAIDKAPLELRRLVALYRLADFCVVSSLHDGMNLVAKEFVAAREDLGGVLVLSELTGAAQELTDALLINPYHVEGFAQALETGHLHAAR